MRILQGHDGPTGMTDEPSGCEPVKRHRCHLRGTSASNWLDVGTTAVCVLVAVAILILMSLGVIRPLERYICFPLPFQSVIATHASKRRQMAADRPIDRDGRARLERIARGGRLQGVSPSRRMTHGSVETAHVRVIRPPRRPACFQEPSARPATPPRSHSGAEDLQSGRNRSASDRDRARRRRLRSRQS